MKFKKTKQGKTYRHNLDEKHWLKFTKNNKGQNPKISVKFHTKNERIPIHLGSVPQDQIDSCLNILLSYWELCTSIVEFLSYSRSYVKGDFVILGFRNREEWEAVLNYYAEEFI